MLLTIQRDIQYRILLVWFLRVGRIDGHCCISAFDHKAEGFSCAYKHLLVERLVVHIKLFVFVYNQQIQVTFLGVFDADDTVLLLAVS